ncbi:wax ester/triacylglycerol synthase domain-containing protein [Panacagrimonas perspica]|nr:wax ester/triacylglycerol synthase domain-containing protein [Panacagrimonas perspica]
MWRMDHFPNLRSAVVCVVVLDREPDATRIQQIHRAAAQSIPRLREKLVEVPLGLPAWVADERFELGVHLRVHPLAAGAGIREVLDHAAEMAMAPFDHARPPWEAHVVTGMKGGGAAYVLKLHHALSDGIGIVQLLSMLFSRRREIDGAPFSQVAAPSTMPGSPATLRLLGRQLERRLRDLPRRVRSGYEIVQRQVRSAEGLSGAVSELAKYAGSVRRAMAPLMAEPSPLLKARNHRWRFETLDVPLAKFKAAAKACGATLNDAYVAGLLGGFARYHRENGVEVDEIPIGMPINVRAQGAAGGGNHFAPGQLVGPLGELGPMERMRLIGAQVSRLRNEPALSAPLALMPMLVSLPSDTLAKIMGPKMAANDLQCSNVPGLREDVFLAGAQATRLYPYAPLPGVPAMISLVTHGENCCIGMNLDSAAIADAARFTRCQRESLDEILALEAGPGGKSKRAIR